MSDLIPIEAESAPGQNPNRTPAFFRRAVRRLLRPVRQLFHYYQRDIVARMEQLESRLNRVEWLVEVSYKKADGLSSHLDELTRNHWALQSRFDAVVVQYEGLLRLLPGIDHRFETLDENLSAVHALHWDHVALARRLGAIEDVLAATGDTAKETIEDGRGRPLLPFPGMDSHDLKKSKVS